MKQPHCLRCLVKRFPKWFPGTFYAEYSRQQYPVVKQFHDYPYDDVKEQQVSFVFFGGHAQEKS
jgi:hypothetical protein